MEIILEICNFISNFIDNFTGKNQVPIRLRASPSRDVWRGISTASEGH